MPESPFAEPHRAARPRRGRPTRRAALIVAALAALSGPARSEQRAEEAAPAFKASALLTPALVKGPHHQVDDRVTTDGYFHEFAITSTFGAFVALGRTQLAVRIQEIDALAALQEVSKTKVFLESAGQSVVKVGEGVVSAVQDPGDTAKNLGAGVKRFGVNLGRRTQRAVENARDDSPEDPNAPKGDSAGASAANALLGVNAAMRRWAAKVGVDPYTTNAVLRDTLESIAKVDAAGSIATKVVLPIPPVVGMTANVGHLVWGLDPEALRKLNEQRLKELAVPEGTAKAFLTSQKFTLTAQTRLIAALHAVRVVGCADYVATAAEAGSEREALFFVESAELLEARHPRDPVTGILTDSRALVAKTRRGSAVALLPLDWVRVTAATDKAIQEIAARARQELGASSLEMVLTGQASKPARAELTAAGWKLLPRL